MFRSTALPVRVQPVDQLVPQVLAAEAVGCDVALHPAQPDDVGDEVLDVGERLAEAGEDAAGGRGAQGGVVVVDQVDDLVLPAQRRQVVDARTYSLSKCTPSLRKRRRRSSSTRRDTGSGKCDASGGG